METQHEKLIDKWRYIMKDSTSPDSFIDMSFYFLIGACLQRRVWIGASHHPIYAGQYLILVGEPGVGKGLQIHEINNMLSYHELGKEHKTVLMENNTERVNKEQIDEELQEILRDAGEGTKLKKKKKNLLIPIGANCTTYEKLVDSLEGAYRTHLYRTINEEGKEVVKRYTHNSLAFCLSELESLFSKNTDKLVAFFTEIWDGEPYKYETKHCGENSIPRPCISFYAGTNPQFMEEAFNSKLIGKGFTARVLFVYEATKRFERFAFPERNEQQQKYIIDILNRIPKLAKLYGQVTYTEEAFEYLRYFFEEIHPKARINKSPRLFPYYERKKMHAQKLAMAIHFAESDDMVIQKETCEEAVEILGRLEQRMHLALSFGGKNPLGKIAKEIDAFLRKIDKPMTYVDIWKEFIGDVKDNELREVLDFLCRSGKVIHKECEIGNTRMLAYISI